MKSIAYFSFFLSILLGFNSCVDGTSVLPNSSGRANEVLLVMDDQLYETEVGQKIMGDLQQQVVGLAWDEPFFDVSRLNRQTYSELFRLSRNIVYVDVSNMYTIPQVKMFKDLHAKDQSFVRIQSPDVTALDSLMEKESNRILSFLYTNERARTIKYFKRNKSETLSDSIKALYGIDIVIPTSFNRHSFKKDFVWMAAGNTDDRQYLAFYSYPYKDDSTFTEAFQIAKRDSFMKANIPGSVEGSFVKTSFAYAPTFRSYTKKGLYVAELRGLWETEGDAMGGPFVSNTVVDQKNNRIITVEGFVYAPNRSKRNLLRQLEAILYTIQLAKEQPAEESNS